MSKAADIKTQIQSELEELETAGTIGEVIKMDVTKGILEHEIAAYPAVIIRPPAIENDEDTNGTNLRTYVFTLAVILKGEDVTADDVEDLQEALVDKFDNNTTLNDEADAGVEASSIDAQPVSTGDGSIVYFEVSIRAKAIKVLNRES